MRKSLREVLILTSIREKSFNEANSQKNMYKESSGGKNGRNVENREK